MLAAYAIAVTRALAIVWLAAEDATMKMRKERDAAMALQEREQQRLILALDELDRIDPTGLSVSRVLIAEREGLH